MRAACPFVEVVHILGYYLHIYPAFGLGYSPMASIRLCPAELPPTLIVELLHQLWVPLPGLWGCHVLYTVLLPEPIGIPKGLYTALGAYPCSRQYHQFLPSHS